MEKETKYSILVGLFVMALTVSALTGVKIIPLWGVFFSATAITFPITFLVTDIVSEVWGKKKAHQVVWIGFFTVIIAYILVFIAIKLPPAPIWQGQEAYAQTLGLVGRIIFGDVDGFPVGIKIDHLLRLFQTCNSGLIYKNPRYLPFATKQITISI